MFLIPIDDIIPKSRIEIPPITGPGMVEMIEVNLGTNDKIIAKTAAIRIIRGL